MDNFHFGRSWEGTLLEDDCPCGKAPCGLVDVNKVDPTCPEHSLDSRKTIRQGHFEENCGGKV